MHVSQPLNKRNFSRVFIDNIQILCFLSGAEVCAQVVNLSEGGAMVLVKIPLEYRLFFKIKIMSAQHQALNPIHGRARVVHHCGGKVHPSSFYAGLRFHDFNESDKARLRKLIASVPKD